jgi:hypothetical protein
MTIAILWAKITQEVGSQVTHLSFYESLVSTGPNFILADSVPASQNSRGILAALRLL